MIINTTVHILFMVMVFVIVIIVVTVTVVAVVMIGSSRTATHHVSGRHAFFDTVGILFGVVGLEILI